MANYDFILNRLHERRAELVAQLELSGEEAAKTMDVLPHDWEAMYPRWRETVAAIDRRLTDRSWMQT
jgi:hypothetical protein